MIAYITLGVDDIARARPFYQAILPALGYVLDDLPEGLSYAIPVPNGARPIHPDIYIKNPFDGQPATAGNGTMIALEAQSQAQVRALHQAALAAGGTNDGAAGFRADYGPNFYVAYLRDPQGNKFALFSSDPSEPGRDD